MLPPNVKTVAVILVMIVPFVCAYVDKAGSDAGFVRCPDRRRCPDGEKCCYFARHGRYDCCAHSQGVCCTGRMDGICCRPGFRCNEAEVRCDPGVKKTKPTDWDATEIRRSERELLPDQRFDFE